MEDQSQKYVLAQVAALRDQRIIELSERERDIGWSCHWHGRENHDSDIRSPESCRMLLSTSTHLKF